MVVRDPAVREQAETGVDTVDGLVSLEEPLDGQAPGGDPVPSLAGQSDRLTVLGREREGPESQTMTRDFEHRTPRRSFFG